VRPPPATASVSSRGNGGGSTRPKPPAARALDIRRETDRQAAASTATRLGAVLATLGRHVEAARTLLYAAITWRQETGQWPQEDLDLLRRERQAVKPAEFAALVEAEVPPDLAQELNAAIEEDPNQPAGTEQGQNGD